MTSCIQTINSYQTAHLHLSEVVLGTAIRRRLQAELNEIATQLENFDRGHRDALSEQIRMWHAAFNEAIKTNQPIQPILNDYITLLKEILVDPLAPVFLDDNSLFDDNPLLGSDGNCYSTQTLSLWMNLLPEEYRMRSPLNIDNPDQEIFTTEKHETASYMIEWLKSHQVEWNVPEPIQVAYQSLIDDLGEQKTRRLIPNARNNRINRIQKIAAIRRMRQEETRIFQQQLDEVKVAITDVFLKECDSITERIHQFSQNIIDEVNQVGSEHREKLRCLHEQVEQLETEMGLLRQEIEELSHEISSCNAEIEKAKLENLQIKQAIKQVERAIKKKKKRDKQAIMNSLLLIPVSILGSHLVSQIVGGVSLHPTTNNGLFARFRVG